MKIKKELLSANCLNFVEKNFLKSKLLNKLRNDYIKKV